MPSVGRLLLLLFLATGTLVSAQCPVDTVLVKGRVENPSRNAKVRVQLIFANGQPGPAAETAPEGGALRLPIEFLTQSTRPLLRNLKPKCDRKPTSVVVKLLAGDQEVSQVTLNFPRDFNELDPTAYTPRSEVVLKSSQ